MSTPVKLLSHAGRYAKAAAGAEAATRDMCTAMLPSKLRSVQRSVQRRFRQSAYPCIMLPQNSFPLGKLLLLWVISLENSSLFRCWAKKQPPVWVSAAEGAVHHHSACTIVVWTIPDLQQSSIVAPPVSEAAQELWRGKGCCDVSALHIICRQHHLGVELSEQTAQAGLQEGLQQGQHCTVSPCS